MELLKSINKAEVLKYLGFRGGELDREYDIKIDEAAKLVMEVATPKLCFVKLKIESHDPLKFENTDIVFQGEDIKKHLATSSECVFMAATLGNGIDRLIKKASAVNMADAVIYDACASSAIENVCDNYTRLLEEEYGKEGLFLTDRFSPGYGDLPLESQEDFCRITSCNKKIGLCHNRSMMLEPTKSVTAMIGISATKQEKRLTGCAGCKLAPDCKFRKRGVTCYE